MKSILVLMASLLFSDQSIGGSTRKSEITDSFIDIVKSVTEEDKQMTIKFTQHSSIYRIPKDNPNYEELKNMLEKMQKNEKKIKIIAIIPTMEIKEVKLS
jgi:hypothetical protein